MDHNWERAAEILNSTRPYLRYLLLPFGVYAANRLISAILPGAHHQPKLDLRGRVVLITGASSGLGEQLAVTFYKYGAKVIITARSIDKLKEICADLKALPNVNNPYEPVYKYLDICDPNGIDEILSLLPEQKVDVLVNNAGLSMRGNCEDTPMNIHRQIMEVNYFGHIALTKALLKYIPDDGAIVYISSMQGRIAVPFRSAYCASKHAGQFCNYRGYIKINQNEFRRDVVTLRNRVVRLTGKRQENTLNDLDSFVKKNAYVLGGFAAGCLLGYTFA